MPEEQQACRAWDGALMCRANMCVAGSCRSHAHMRTACPTMCCSDDPGTTSRNKPHAPTFTALWMASVCSSQPCQAQTFQHSTRDPEIKEPAPTDVHGAVDGVSLLQAVVALWVGGRQVVGGSQDVGGGVPLKVLGGICESRWGTRGRQRVAVCVTARPGCGRWGGAQSTRWDLAR